METYIIKDENMNVMETFEEYYDYPALQYAMENFIDCDHWYLFRADGRMVCHMEF